MSILSKFTASPITNAPMAVGALPNTVSFGITTGTMDQQASVSQVVALLGPNILASIFEASPTELPASSIYQRTTRSGGAYSLGTASIAFNISISIGGLPLLFRLRDATASGNPLLQVASQALALTTTGMQVVSIPVPCGPYWYFVDWSLGASDSWTLGTHKIAVGEIVALAGQSLADRLMHDFSGITMANIGVTPPVLHSSFMTWTDSGGSGPVSPVWSPVADGQSLDSAFTPQLAYRLLSAYNIPVAVVGYTHGGTSISTWQPGQPDYLALKSVLAAQGGNFATLLWFQGHSDALAGVSATNYSNSLAALVGQLRSDFPLSTGMKVLISTIPNITSTSWGSSAQIDAIRNGGMTYVSTNSGFASHITPLDLVLTSDGTHQDQNGNVGMADHVFRALSGALGLTTSGDGGPKLTGIATRGSGSAVIKLMVAAAGGTALIPSPTLAAVTTQFQVFASGSIASPYTVANIAFPSPTEIDLTLSVTPPDSLALGVRYRMAPDGNASIMSSGIYDNNVADGLLRGRQLQMYVGEITVPAPGTGSVVFSSPGVPSLSGTGVGGGGSAPTPLAFFKADTLTGAAGSPITTLSDTTGNGHGLVAVGGGPTLSLAGVNGLNVATFSAGQSFTNVSGTTWMTGLQGSFTMLLVFELPSTSTQIVVVSSGQNVGGNNNAFYILTPGSSGGALQFMRQNSSGTTSGPPFAGSLTAGSVIKAVARYNATTGLATLNVNGSRVATTITTPDAGAGAWNFFDINNYQVGAFTGPLIWCETNLWSGLASDVDETALLNYATSKWGH